MTVNHASTMRTALAQAILDATDAGSGVGYIEFQTSGDVEVSTHALLKPSGVVSGNTLTFATVADDSNAAGGTIAHFRVFDSDDNEVWNGSAGVSGSGAEAILSSLAITPGEAVSVTSVTYTASV